MLCLLWNLMHQTLFSRTVPNFCQLPVNFGQWSKVFLSVNSQPEIQILNLILLMWCTIQWCVVIVNWCRFFPSQYHCQIAIFMIALGYLAFCWICRQRDVIIKKIMLLLWSFFDRYKYHCDLWQLSTLTQILEFLLIWNTAHHGVWNQLNYWVDIWIIATYFFTHVHNSYSTYVCMYEL